MPGNIELVNQLREINGQALGSAISGDFLMAYSSFQQAEEAGSGLDATDPEVVMATADTLRDWAFTYARDGAKTSDAVERATLFEAADNVFKLALAKTAVVIDPVNLTYENKNQRKRATDTHYATHSVRAKAHHLHKLVDGSVQGDEPDFGIANRGLRPSYWSVSNDMHALSYIRTKDPAPNETIHTSKSTLLHLIPWIARATKQLPLVFVTATEDAYFRERSINQSASKKQAVRTGIAETRQAARQYIGIGRALRSKSLTRDIILQHP